MAWQTTSAASESALVWEALPRRNTMVWAGSIAAMLSRDPDFSTLPDDERQPEPPFKLAGDRERHCASRILLRHALSQALDGTVEPSRWRFTKLAGGKPVIAKGLPAVSFNVSHTADAVAVAICHEGTVGIDIEKLDAAIEFPLDGCLTVREKFWLKTLPTRQRSAGFLRLWCAKEAFAKSLGLGVAIPFDLIEVDPVLLTVACDLEIIGQSLAHALEVRTIMVSGQPYVLAVAQAGSGGMREKLQFRSFDHGNGQAA